MKRGAPEIAQQAQVGLEPGQQQEQAHADDPEGVEQVQLLGARGEDGGERRRRVVAEQAGAERDAARHLADHGRQPDPLGDLRADPRHADQERQLDEQQEDGVTRQARLVHATPTLARRVYSRAIVADDDKTGTARRVRTRVLVRIVPYLLLLYFVAYLDRVNISYAALEMRHDLRLTDSQYGFGAGIFFFGYFLFEIPGTLMVEAWSARKWIARILVGWGLVACAMAFIETPRQFFWLRFLLGAAEAGFFPGVVVYLSHWFRVEDRARAFAFFMLAVPISNIVGAPVSGLLLGVHWGGLAGWRWLFLLEGLPAIVLGVVTIYFLTDRPRDARWLTAAEKDYLQEALARESAETPPQGPGGWSLARAVFRREILLLVLAYFGIVTTSYGFSLWMPTVVKSLTGLPNFTVSLLATLPYVAGGICTAVDRPFVRSHRRAALSRHRPDADGGRRPLHRRRLGRAGGPPPEPGAGRRRHLRVHAAVLGDAALVPLGRGRRRGGRAHQLGRLPGRLRRAILDGKNEDGGDRLRAGLAALGATATFAAVMVFLVRPPRRIAV